MRFLVENGADINERDGFGEHGLGLAFARQDLKIAEYLLSQGVKLREEALSIAGSAQSVTLLDRVLAAGADVNARIVALKSTPLIMATAAEQTRPETLKWLLDKGADPNAKGIDGDRALDWAIYRADQGRIDLLKRYGANPGAATRVTSYPPPEGVADPRAAVERSVVFTAGDRAGGVSDPGLHYVSQPNPTSSGRNGRTPKGIPLTSGCWKPT